MRGRTGDASGDPDFFFDPTRTDHEHRSSSAPPDQHLLYLTSSTATTPITASDAGGIRRHWDHHHQQQQHHHHHHPMVTGAGTGVASPLYDSARQAWSSTPSHVEPNKALDSGIYLSTSLQINSTHHHHPIDAGYFDAFSPDHSRERMWNNHGTSSGLMSPNLFDGGDQGVSKCPKRVIVSFSLLTSGVLLSLL